MPQELKTRTIVGSTRARQPISKEERFHICCWRKKFGLLELTQCMREKEGIVHMERKK
jgi:hypothetical protein